MNADAPACKFFTFPGGNSSHMMIHGPQDVIKEREFNAFYDDNQKSLCKKTRICENAISGPKMCVGINSAMSANFKTQLCENFRLGHCSYGSKCHFAHGMDDVRKRLHKFEVSVNDNEHRLRRTWIRDDRMKDQSRLCRMVCLGKECKYGANCCFRHPSPQDTKKDRGRYGESSAISIGTSESSRDQRNEFVKSTPVFTKRKLCLKWEMTGCCPYGKICCFAHGLAEVGAPVRNIALVPKIAPNNVSKTFYAKGRLGKSHDPRNNDRPGNSHDLHVKGMKCIFKKKAISKIIGIYADWIEDMPLVHGH